jgi:hypothetical protein
LRFVENRGQADPQVNYYLQGSGTSVWFTPTGLTYGLTDSLKHAQPAPGEARSGGPAPRENQPGRWDLKLDFVGARPTTPVAAEPAAGSVSYFKGSPQE